MKNQELLKQAKQLFKQANQTMDQGIMFLSEFMDENKDEPKQSELELMKEKLATGDYVCYSGWKNGNSYGLNPCPEFNDLEIAEYKLIHKDHAHIAEEALNGIMIYNKTQDFFHNAEEFFDEYDESYFYEGVKEGSTPLDVRFTKQLAKDPHNHELVFEPKEWYKNPENFPALISNGESALVLVHYFQDNYVFDLRDAKYAITNSNWKLATEAERNSLFVAPTEKE